MYIKKTPYHHEKSMSEINTAKHFVLNIVSTWKLLLWTKKFHFFLKENKAVISWLLYLVIIFVLKKKIFKKILKKPIFFFFCLSHYSLLSVLINTPPFYLLALKCVGFLLFFYPCPFLNHKNIWGYCKILVNMISMYFVWFCFLVER